MVLFHALIAEREDRVDVVYADTMTTSSSGSGAGMGPPALRPEARARCRAQPVVVASAVQAVDVVRYNNQEIRIVNDVQFAPRHNLSVYEPPLRSQVVCAFAAGRTCRIIGGGN